MCWYPPTGDNVYKTFKLRWCFCYFWEYCSCKPFSTVNMTGEKNDIFEIIWCCFRKYCGWRCCCPFWKHCCCMSFNNTSTMKKIWNIANSFIVVAYLILLLILSFNDNRTRKNWKSEDWLILLLLFLFLTILLLLLFQWCNHRHLSNIDCLSFVMCLLLAPVLIVNRLLFFFFCCGH